MNDKRMIALFWAGLILVLGLHCSPDTSDSDNMDAGTDGDTDTDADTDADTDSDGDDDDDDNDDNDDDVDDDDNDDDECDEDSGDDTCGDADIPDAGADAYCGVLDCDVYLGDSGYPFDNESAPFIGNAESPKAVMTGFSYFHCPHCVTASEAVKEVFGDSDYADKVVFYFSHYPDPRFWNIHRAAHAAHLQGFFWEVHNYFFGDEFFDLTDEETDEDEELHAFIEALNILDMDLYMTDFASKETEDYLSADVGELSASFEGEGMPGTPSFFVNGRQVMPWKKFKNVLDYVLAHKK